MEYQGEVKRNMVVLTGNSHPELANATAFRLGKPLGNCKVYKAPTTETQVEILETVRKRDVFIIQTGTLTDVNNTIMELLIMSYACKTACANQIIGVIPYMPYSKQSKMRKRGSIVSKLIAQMMGKSGLTHIITMDLHQKEIQGFFDVPIDNLRASSYLINYLKQSIVGIDNSVIVARRPHAAQRATSFAERLKVDFAVFHGELKTENELDGADGRCSPPPVRKGRIVYSSLMPPMVSKAKPPLSVVGSVKDKLAIIYDDIFDSATSLACAAAILLQNDATSVYAVATHGIFDNDDVDIINASKIDGVIITNTIPASDYERSCSKFCRVDISGLLSEAIRRKYNGESMSYLFRNVSHLD